MSEKKQIPPPSSAKIPSQSPNKNFHIKTPRFTLEKGVILSERTRMQLDECLARLRFHEEIYDGWGFAEVDPMGRTAILNFYGPPGTGKTLSAEALAGTLEMSFLSIGTADLESKFMGETAKNIQAVFKEAAQKKALLFFDEADTLLGRRLSSVTQGVDNEVNAMRSTLLIEIERYTGIVVFATNFADNYDEAFRSRIGYHIEFTLPDETARRQLWDHFLVRKIPLGGNGRDDILDDVARYSEGLSGREIRTCLRLALPKAMIQGSKTNSSPLLELKHLQEAITQVQQSRDNVATSSRRSGNRLNSVDKAAVRNFLGKTEKESESNQ